MDDFSQKLSALLSDPESMQNLAELAQMLREPESGGGSAAGAAPAPDLQKLMSAAQVLGQVQQDDTAALLLALKPHLSAERAQRADKAVRMLRIWRAAGILRENGLLADIL